ncbi:MAG TPA: universal stress protein [Nannocystaceae bacterium]|nr:universal stress protein [Nannocystaceae bacterium]
MRWIVGIDRLEHTLGAPQLARWLAMRAAPKLELFAVHVVEHTKTSAKIGEGIAGIVDAARETLRAALATACDGATFDAVDIVLAPDASHGLATVASREGADGILVDRRADRIGHGLVRLGRVARNLLRTLPVPVLVVPHDLAAVQIGAGPIVVATDLGPASVPAMRFAGKLASQLGRPLTALHVSPGLDPFPSFYGEGVNIPVSEHRGVAEVEQWMRAHELAAADVGVLEGSVVEAIIAEARRIEAPMIVCGTEHLSPLVRLFSASVAGDLARLADRAVLVVPG